MEKIKYLKEIIDLTDGKSKEVKTWLWYMVQPYGINEPENYKIVPRSRLDRTDKILFAIVVKEYTGVSWSTIDTLRIDIKDKLKEMGIIKKPKNELSKIDEEKIKELTEEKED